MWRRANPHLAEADRVRWVSNLMRARRAVRTALAAGGAGLEAARADVDAAKTALGERGEVWWVDGAPDLNRRLVKTTSYADWHAGLEA